MRAPGMTLMKMPLFCWTWLITAYLLIAVMRKRGAAAAPRPWEGAEGLEWDVPSPAPFHTYEHRHELDVTATRVLG